MEELLSIRLQKRLQKSLDKKGVDYSEIFTNGSFVYSQYPEKRNYLFTVVTGNRKVPVSWNPDRKWVKGTHTPHLDPRYTVKRDFQSLIRHAFRNKTQDRT